MSVEEVAATVRGEPVNARLADHIERLVATISEQTTRAEAASVDRDLWKHRYESLFSLVGQPAGNREHADTPTRD